MSSRSRRTAAAEPRGNKVAGALAELAAARSGQRRALTYEVKQEEAVYDVVDEDQYAQIVAKRRMDADEFIEDAGGDYLDLGEEDDFWGRGGDQDTADGGDGAAGKKRKGGAKDGPASKKAAGGAAPRDPKAKDRLQQMFAKAAVRSSAAAAGSGPKGTDAAAASSLMDDIIASELGLDPSTAAAAGGGSGRGGGAGAGQPKTFVRHHSSTAAAPLGRPAAAAAAVGGAGSRGLVPGRAPAAGAPRPGAAGVAKGPPAAKRPLGGGTTAGGSAAAGAGRRGPPVGAAAAAAAAAAAVGGSGRGVKRPAAEVTAAAADEEEQEEFDYTAAAGGGDQEEFSFGQAPAESAPEAGVSDPFAAPSDTPAAGEGGAGVKPEAAAVKVEPGGGLTANPGRMFAEEAPSAADGAPGAANGWMEVFEAPVAAGSSADGGAAAAAGAGASPEPLTRAGAAGGSAVKAEPGAAAAATGGAGTAGAAAADGVVLEPDGKLAFYFLDAYENPDRPDTAYFFGKVPVAGGKFQSCCAVVGGLHYSLIVVPAPWVFADGAGDIAAAEARVAEHPEDKVELLKLLHGRCADLKAELRALLLKHGVKSMRVVPVKRRYAFEDASIPHGEQWVLKVRYPASEPALPPGLTGQHFRALTGVRSVSLETLLLKRGLKGPGWLALDVQEWRSGSGMVSWCKREVVLSSPKALSPAAPGTPLAARPPPPLTVASLSLRVHTTAASNHSSEILAASVVHLSGVSPDAPMPREAWSSPAALRNFSIVRKLDGRPWPAGFEQGLAADNASPRGRLNGGTMLTACPTERALLSCLLTRLTALDVDVLVGHNISAFDLSVLLHRLQHHKVPMWSRIGRLSRSTFPKLTGGGHVFGGGASPGALGCLAGRLLCDTYLAARELLREVDYTLKTLARTQLGQERGEVSPEALLAAYDSGPGLRQLLMAGESDAWLALGLMFQLSVLPLTKQLTVLSGSLWNKTLQGARAQRIEMLLLHEFHDRKFILPEKFTGRDRFALEAAQQQQAGAGKGKKGGKKGAKGAAAGAAEVEGDAADGPQPPSDDEEEAPGGAAPAAAPAATGGSKRAKGPQYAGGLVLEPKKGLYDNIVIMLDFNSLYPSIIQEYNICFTTVERPADGTIPPLPPGAGGGSLAPLPLVIQGLVARRREVKAQMKSCRDPVLHQQLHIRQQALKLTANSMYGCLGFTNSRFYCRPLAELITSQGREILQSTVDLVTNMGSGLEVVYGDTDSIMIHTGTKDLNAARQLGASVKREVNKRYRLLEIELDAVFKTMLLLKKKKYAAIKLEPTPEGGVAEVLEAKGLDIVRRDWCPLSKECGQYVLQQVLSGASKEDVVAAVHEHLRGVAAGLGAGAVPLGKFVITKQLTKRLEDYPDAKNQPHVQVALRRRAAGKRDGVMPGETVPYIICVRRSLEEQQQQQQQQPKEEQVQRDGEAGTEAAGTPQQQQQQEGEGAPSPAPAPAAAGPSSSTPGQQQQQQQVAAGGTTPGAPLPPSSNAGKGGGKPAALGGIAERAFHPEELREDPSLAVDRDYYLSQQVHPVVARLCAPIEGTDAGQLASCLGLDASRFAGGGSGRGRDGAAALREEALQVCGSILDDDAHYAGCEPLQLKAANGTSWAFRGVRSALKEGTPGEALLCPPDAVGDPGAALSAAQVANQAVLAARAAIVKYYEGTLRSDDDMAPYETRDVVMRPLGAAHAAEAGSAATTAGCLPVPDPKSNAVLTRVLTEDQLYRQLSSYARLLDARGALEAVRDVQQRDAARKLVGSCLPVLEAAYGGVSALRDASAYRWINLGSVFGCFAPPQAPLGAAGTGAASARSSRQVAAGQQLGRRSLPVAAPT